tara:strand:- start:2449 stop:3648 length:1200 start_codon:yes stop_codon:yes gene_type:complete
MNNLLNKKILLIICGGISAYKSLEIIRSFKKRGVQVKTILTKSAKKFVTPLSVTALSQDKVYDDIFNVENESEMDHISLSRWADLILVAPATANTISKLSNGSSDDLASTVILASNKKIFLVPAMNVRMWEHKSTKDNLNKLSSFGYKIIGPEIGDMACGEFGKGKMTEPNQIIEIIENYINQINNTRNFKALVTAGPTREYIDPVRYITNESSGKQGYALAKSFVEYGFKTTLISGKTNLEKPDGVKFIQVNTAEEMFNETLHNLPVDVAVFSAAVSDFKIKNYNEKKIKKTDDFNLELDKNIDILSHISNHNSLRPRLSVGFAAETNDLRKNAIKKLNDKNCDWIISNDVSDKSIGFNSELNKVSIFYKDQKEETLEKASKISIAEEIVKRVVNKLN